MDFGLGVVFLLVGFVVLGFSIWANLILNGDNATAEPKTARHAKSLEEVLTFK